jgi:hypothetical protein
MKQAKPQSIWLDAIQWLRNVDRTLPQDWPAELPPESTPGFWQRAAELEMQHRTPVSQKTECIIRDGHAPASMTALELWFYRRRVEWAAQVIIAKAQEGVQPLTTLSAVLTWALIGSWDSDGCIGFWTHAIERHGNPHPENPDGLSPVKVP